MAAKVLEGKTGEDCHGQNVDDLLNGIKSLHINNDTDKNVPPWLINCESPFHWHSLRSRALSTDHTIQRCLEKMDELSLGEHEFSMRRYTVLLKLLLEYSIMENEEKVYETMETIKMFIKKDSIESDIENSDYERYKLILAHVVSATEAYLLASDEEQSKKIAQVIVPVDQMPNSNKAGLCEMKTIFIFFYQNPEDLGEEFAREAMALEPDNPRWLYLLAKVLRKKRRAVPFSDDIPSEELVLLEKAVKQSEKSKYLYYLAQVYRECAAQTHKQHRNRPNFFSSELHKNIQSMQEKALHHYKEVLRLKPDHAGNLRRVGYGIMNLPPNLADYDLAIECLLKSSELCHKFSTLHMIGTFYHRYGKDNKKALEYFEKTVNAGSDAGLHDMIRVKYIEDPDHYNPCEDLDKGLEWQINTKHRVFLLTQKGGYFLFIKRDFLKSMPCFNQAIAEDKDSLHWSSFKSIFLRMFDTINLYHFLVNEALLYLEQNKSEKESGSDDNIYEVLAFIDTITNIHPELLEIEPDPFLIDKLCETSNENMKKEKYKQMPQRNAQNHFHCGWGDDGFRYKRGGSSGGGEGSDNFYNKSGRPFSGRQSNQKQAYEGNSGRFSGISRERGRYQNDRKIYESKSDKDKNWRKK